MSTGKLRLATIALAALPAVPALAAEWFLVQPEQTQRSVSLVLYPQGSGEHAASFGAEGSWLFLPEILRNATQEPSAEAAAPQGLRLAFMVSHDTPQGQPGSPVLVADCADRALLRALGLSSTCAALTGQGYVPRDGHWTQAEAGASWTLGSAELSLSGGIGLLRPEAAGFSAARAPAALPGPWANAYGLHGTPVDSARSQWLGLGSSFGLGRDGSWSLGLNVQRDEFDLGTVLGGLNSASFAIGVVYGALSGGVATRVQALDLEAQPNVHFGTMDLGFTWRTPWSARISFGAQNLLSTPPSGPIGISPDPVIESARARTPYVRYHQDL